MDRKVDVCPECGEPLVPVIYVGKRAFEDVRDGWSPILENGVKVWFEKDDFVGCSSVEVEERLSVALGCPVIEVKQRLSVTFGCSLVDVEKRLAKFLR